VSSSCASSAAARDHRSTDVAGLKDAAEDC
jgi:hypothetical protein